MYILNYELICSIISIVSENIKFRKEDTMKNKIKYIPTARVQFYWIFCALVLLLAGLHVVNVPDSELVAVANHLGIAMLFAGSINFVVYIKNRKAIHGCHWILADALTAVFLSVFPLFNTMIPPLVLPFFFGIWELFSGIGF